MTALPLQAGLPGPGTLPASTRERIVPRRILPLRAGRRLACAEAGLGPDLVAIHGTLTVLEDLWLGPVPTLTQEFRVVAVDRPGHGFSERLRLQDASPWRQAELIREGMRALGLRRPVILGHSLGGAVALAYGLLYPDEIAGVVALAPICFPEPRLEQALFGPRAVPVAGEALSQALHLTADPALLRLLWEAMFLPRRMPDSFRQGFPFGLAGRPVQLVADGEDAASLWPGLFRSALSYGACRVPVHILAGDADIVVHSGLHGLNAARMIPGGRFDVLPGQGHMLHHFEQEAVLRAALAIREAAA